MSRSTNDQPAGAGYVSPAHEGFICSDEDFHSAMEIVKATINHSLLLISSLPGDEVNPKALKSYFRIRFVIE